MQIDCPKTFLLLIQMVKTIAIEAIEFFYSVILSDLKWQIMLTIINTDLTQP